jgi:hypothetical protein
MPAFDETGPQGAGPMTGRGMGPCGKGMGRRFGLGFGFGQGARRGLGRFFGGGQAWSKKDLEDYKKALKEELEDVDKELANEEK